MRVRPLAVLLTALLPAAATAAETAETLLAWIAGEYDNHQQVWQHRLDQADGAMVHVHVSVDPVALGDDAAYLLRAWQIGDRSQLLAQQLYRPESRGGAAATITRYDLGGSAIDLRSSEDGMQLPRAIASVLARMPGCVLRLTRHDNHVRARPEQPCTDIALPPTLRERDGFESGPDLLTLPLPAADRPLAARRVRLISG